MKKSLSLTIILLVSFLVALLITISGCKKDKDDSPGGSCKVTKIENAGNDTAQLAYNSDGKIASYGSANYALYTFTYSGLTASSTVTKPDTTIPYMNMFLNASGRVESMNLTYYFGSSNVYYTYSFSYDADGHIVGSEQSYRESGSLDTYYYKDSLIYQGGNLTRKYTFAKTNSDPYLPYSHLEITYGSEENKAGYYIFSFWEEPISVVSGWQAFYHLFGNSSKNLPATTRYFDNTNTELFKLTYSFLLDANGYPTDENIVRTGLYPGARNRKLFYSCN